MSRLLARRGAHSAAGVRRGPVAMPVINRGVPVSASNDFGGPYAAVNAVDSDYSTLWRSITSPNGGTPQWIVQDLRGVPVGQRGAVWVHLLNPTRPAFQPGAAVGSQNPSLFSQVFSDYQLQGHASSGAQPAVGDAGWTDLIAPVTGNTRSDVVHPLDLSGYNWFRFYCTVGSGLTGTNDDVRVQIDIHDASGGTDDSIAVYGDSVSMEAWEILRLDGVAWSADGAVSNGAMQELLAAKLGRSTPPVLSDYSTGGWTASQGHTSIASYIGGQPHKYVVLHFGKNDANGIQHVMADTSDAAAQAFLSDMQAMIDYLHGLGKLVLLAHITWGNANAWTESNIVVLNQIIDQLVAGNVGKAIALSPAAGFYSLFHDQPQLIVDGLHPGWDPAQTAQLYSGRTGFDWLHQLYRDSLAAAVYGVS